MKSYNMSTFMNLTNNPLAGVILGHIIKTGTTACPYRQESARNKFKETSVYGVEVGYESNDSSAITSGPDTVKNSDSIVSDWQLYVKEIAASVLK